MITVRLQICAIVLVLVFLVVMFWLLRRGQLAMKYSLLWIFSGIIMLVLAVFPGVLDSFAKLIGVYSSVNALFAVMLFCGLALMISFTVIVSRDKREIVRLTQEISILEKRIRNLEQNKTESPEGGHSD